VQSSETVLGPIEGISSPGTGSPTAGSDPTQQAQEQQQEQAEKKSDNQGGSDDDSGVDASLGLINAAPVQMKTDLEQPVTSGGMETLGENPSIPTD
jgi:hypothetical protein